ncbi:Putative SOS response-associated peptidase YedK [Massilia sp. PDC64]|nr:SOS response-associated peptidase family protein [Massilia sp. PDC64]SDE32794.1 Putative SOS response-associated peptidase YedK [Massilia sp. PDC64]
MCVNYRPPLPEQLDMVLGTLVDLYRDWDWPSETWKDYTAPIVRAGAGGERMLQLASYGMVPRRHIPAGVKPFDTMNARAESLGEKRSFAPAWRRAQLCAVPMTCFYEPNYESGRAERFGIGMRDDSVFFVAGLWREWSEADGTIAASFTQITINADDHPLMRRFHKPDDEKRALVVLPPNEVDAWLHCRDPEVARSFLRPYPADGMKAWAAPKAPVKKTPPPSAPQNLELF